MQVHSRTPRSSYPHINEDVEMSEVRPPPESEKMTPCFDGNNMEVSSFTYSCRRHLDDYALYYKNDPKAAVVWIEDHLTGDAKKWYSMDELLEQADNPDPERILQRLEKEYKMERNIEEVKTTLLKLKYQWGKAYEYLAEFNRLSRILRLPEETKKHLLMYQVKPSIQETMYDLPEEKKTWEGFVECLRMCDAFPSNYRDDYLDKHDDPQTKMVIIMALLGMIDPRKPSQKIENKRKQKKEFNRNPKFDKDYEKEKPTEIKIDEGNESNNSGNYYKNREWKDRRTSSNNPLPKSPAFAIQERPMKTNPQFKPEAKARSKTGNTPKVTTEVLYDSGSKINVIHSELAKELGIKVTKDPSFYRTVGGNTTIPFVTEEFHVKLKLVEKEIGKIKWYPYNITCRVADIVPNTILLGSRFTDSHLIYRGIDEKDKKIKVFKVGGATECLEEDGMDVGIIY